MFMIETLKMSNGGRRNQVWNGVKPPDGWVTVPPELESEAMKFLPFIDLTIVNGHLIGVSQGVIPPLPDPAPPPEPTEPEDVSALLVDHEYRLTLLELGVI